MEGHQKVVRPYFFEVATRSQLAHILHDRASVEELLHQILLQRFVFGFQRLVRLALGPVSVPPWFCVASERTRVALEPSGQLSTRSQENRKTGERVN
jgi:hypothetical protein